MHGSKPDSYLKSVAFWMRLLLGAIFILASVDKILQPADFAKAVHNYQMLPDSLVNLTAIILPWLELLLGILLIAGVWLPGAVLSVNLLLLVFWCALMFNFARGIDVHCGCFSVSAKGSPSTWLSMARDTLFLLMAAHLFVKTILKPAHDREKGNLPLSHNGMDERRC